MTAITFTRDMQKDDNRFSDCKTVEAYLHKEVQDDADGASSRAPRLWHWRMQGDVSELVAPQATQAGGYWPALVSVAPELEHASRVVRRSTSTGISRSDTGQALPGSNGAHIFVLVQDGGDIERFLRTLHDRCWLPGFGWLMAAAGGQLLERSIVDRMVYAPERLVFEGAPILDPPLLQDLASRRATVTDGAPLDTGKACPALTVVEKARRLSGSGFVTSSRNSWMPSWALGRVRYSRPAPADEVEKQAAQHVLLADQEVEIDPIPTDGGGRRPKAELDRLSNIIRSFNDLFGNITWEDADRIRQLIATEIPDKVAANPAYQNAKQNSDKQNARIEHDRALGNVIVGLMKDDTELFKQFSDNPEFKRWLADTIFSMTFDRPAHPSP